MSTRSRIAIEREDGSLESIYCHSDGYYEYNGMVLNDYYQDEEKVNKLIALGDLSYLGVDPDYQGEERIETSTYEISKQVRDYHRWRDEELRFAKHKDMKDLMKFIDSSDQEFLYVFRNGEWHAMEIEWNWEREENDEPLNKEENLKPLKEIMKKIEQA